VTTVQTIYGTLTEMQLKDLKIAVKDIIGLMTKMDQERKSIKDSLETAADTTGLPKKIIRKIVKSEYKQSFQEEVAENKEFEAVVESMNEIRL
jgi:GH15 family glucan-1,4-alpha-glucosidase